MALELKITDAYSLKLRITTQQISKPTIFYYVVSSGLHVKRFEK